MSNIKPRMKPSKMLCDLVSSAIGAKTHYDVWWAQMSEAKPHLVNVMNVHSDFFLASQQAHYIAFFISLANLFDNTRGSSSLPKYIELIRKTTEPTRFRELQVRCAALELRASPLITIRHNAVAHINARLSEKEVFAPLNITWNEIRSVINDSALFVADLAGASQPGEVGIPREGRLSEAMFRMLGALGRRGA